MEEAPEDVTHDPTDHPTDDPAHESAGALPTVGELVAQLDSTLEALIEVDAHPLTDGELHESVVGLQRSTGRLLAAASPLVREWDLRRVWSDDGSKSPAARLAREVGSAAHTARLAVRRARQLGAMPATTSSLAAGEISPDHVDLLATANARDWPEASFAESEEMLVGFCSSMGYDDARRAISYWKARADPDDAERRDERLHAERSLAVATTIDGVVALSGALDPIGGAAFVSELDRLERALHQDDQRTGCVRTGRQRRADALVEMAHRSRTSPPGGVRPRPLVTILVGEASFARTCELANGHVIAPGRVVPLLGEADIERIVFDGPDRVLSVSHKRTFTGALRRAIEVRDRRCTHPAGCDVRAEHCDVDHTIEHRHGGVTAQHNGRLRCPGHNRDETRRNQRPSGDRGDTDDDDGP